MFRYFYPIVLLFLAMMGFSACEETEEATDPEYLNWQERNSEAFLQKLDEAKTAIAAAQASHGEDWEAYCEWRVYRTYALADNAAALPTDSIAVKIIQRGTGSGCPLYTDSVRINFIGRYIPNELSSDAEARTEGRVFSHTGVSHDYDAVFSPEYSSPVVHLASNEIEGFTTALMQMHIGDLWRIYIPQELGYGSNPNY